MQRLLNRKNGIQQNAAHITAQSGLTVNGPIVQLGAVSTSAGSLSRQALLGSVSGPMLPPGAVMRVTLQLRAHGALPTYLLQPGPSRSLQPLCRPLSFSDIWGTAAPSLQRDGSKKTANAIPFLLAKGVFGLLADC